MFRYFNLLLILVMSTDKALSFQLRRLTSANVGGTNPSSCMVPTLSRSRLHSSLLLQNPRTCVFTTKLHSAKEGNDDKPSSDEQKTKYSSRSSASSSKGRTIDEWLSRLTSAFPIFVVMAAVIGVTTPSAINWVNHGSLISLMLSGVMVGTGLTLEVDDFKDVLKKNWSSVPLGVVCQFAIMPLAACIVGRLFLLPLQAPPPPAAAASAAAAAAAVAMATTTAVPEAAQAALTTTPKVLRGMKKCGMWVASFLRFSSGSAITPTPAAVVMASTPVHVVHTPQAAIGPALFLGLCLVGTSPGGTASNLVTLIAKANVALSVLLTTCSTMLAVVMTPLLTKLLVGSNIRIDGWALCQATARVVLGPVLVGMFLNAKAPEFSRWVSRFTPFASVVLVSLICGGVVALTAPLAKEFSSAVLPTVCLAVFLLHGIGFLLGYVVPRYLFGKSEEISRTVSIEVGMQNSALAVVLAKSVGAPAIAALPGALSATMHSCLGSLLSAYWRMREEPEKKEDVRPKNLPYAAPKDGEFEI